MNSEEIYTEEDYYFFDSYAFFEILKGNPAYEKYKKGIIIVTTKLNLLELHYWLLLRKGVATADSYYSFFEEYTIDFDSGIIRDASKFRAQQRKRELSYIDCIGYVIAKAGNMRFLTGDKQFK